MVLCGANMNVGVWYRNKYPNDECGKFIRPEITFGDMWVCLSNGKDFYDCCGANDSLVRERLFMKLAEIFKVPYDFVYGMWMVSV